MSATNAPARTVTVLPGPGGSIAIPEEFAAELGIAHGTPVRITRTGNALVIERVPDEELAQGSPWLLDLYEYFAPVREEIIAAGYSEDEVNADIDAAIRAVRAQRG